MKVEPHTRFDSDCHGAGRERIMKEVAILRRALSVGIVMARHGAKTVALLLLTLVSWTPLVGYAEITKPNNIYFFIGGYLEQTSSPTAQEACDAYGRYDLGSNFGRGDVVPNPSASPPGAWGSCFVYRASGAYYNGMGYNSLGYVPCPANSTETSPTSCRCNEGYTDNPETGNTCSALIEKVLALGGQCRGTCFSNPIYPLTGSKKEFVPTGVSLAGLALQFTYDTTSALRPPTSGNPSAIVEPAPLGKYWKSNFHRRLQIAPGLKKALLSRGDGLIRTFNGVGNGSYTAEGYSQSSLVTISGGHRVTDTSAGTIETFDSAGRLVSLATTSGAVLSFNYAGQALTSVQGNDGRSVRFLYTDGLIATIVTPEQGEIGIGYDANKNLRTITWPDAKVSTYLYENTAHPWALTGKTDESSSRYATFEYDAQGRAISSSYVGDAQKYSITYGQPARWEIVETFDSAANIVYRVHAWVGPTGTTVTQPNGETFAIDAADVLGMPSISSQTQLAGSGSPSASSAVTYDSRGNVASEDDFAGVRTCYVHDSYDRETERIEGLPTSQACAGVTGGAALPAGARRITTSWHPDWKLPSEIKEPLKKTTYVYHGRPDPFTSSTANCTTAAVMSSGQSLPVLCKVMAQALLSSGAVDSSVGARSRTFTYDAAGRALTTTDPRQNTTTFAYATATTFDAGGDVDFGGVQLLLTGNGTQGSTAITDSSSNASTVAVNGDVHVSTVQSKFGGASLRFDGAGDYLTFPSSTFNFAGAFTIEAWVHPTAAPLNSLINNATGNQFQVGMEQSTRTVFFDNGGTLYGNTGIAPALNAWSHIAVTYDGTILRAFVNGQIAWSTAASLQMPTAAQLRIGAHWTGGYAYNGYLDDVRITTGKARYVASFMPPDLQMPTRVSNGTDYLQTGHTVGDLLSVTDASGKTVQYPQHDRAGRVRQMVDPKGIVTDITYLPRGMVNTMTVTPPGGAQRVTTYTYDNAAQLTGVAMPDGTSMTYSYDAAHRLKEITDGRGNKVTYTLDNFGNRVAEEVRDPSGTLQRSISRAFDALGRLQQVTGAAQ